MSSRKEVLILCAGFTLIVGASAVMTDNPWDAVIACLNAGIAAYCYSQITSGDE